MIFSSLLNAVKNFCIDLVSWLDDLFNVDPTDRPKQLIPLRYDSNKPGKPYYDDGYDQRLFKILLIIITGLLLILTGSNFVFDQ